jgi:hypothetical protein
VLYDGDHASAESQAGTATWISWLPTRLRSFQIRLEKYPRPVIVSFVQDVAEITHPPRPQGDHFAVGFEAIPSVPLSYCRGPQSWSWCRQKVGHTARVEL